MKKLKFFSSVGVFGVTCAFLAIGLIDESSWLTVALSCLGIFAGTHTITDVAAIMKNRGERS